MTDVQTMVDICNRYKRLYTGVVYDILDQLGFPNQALASDIRPLSPDMVVAGPAFTVKGIVDPTGDPDLRERRMKMFKAMSYPCVDVRDCSFDTRVAHYGEMNAVLGTKHGVVGAVIDGGVRDSRYLLQMNIPVFRRYHTPVEAVQRWSYYTWQVPISLRGSLTATVTVNPGDFVFGDLDGVLIIPKELTLEVLRRAEELVNTENQAREEYRTTDDPEVVYRKYQRL